MMDNTYYVEVLKNIRSFFISQTDDKMCIRDSIYAWENHIGD